MEGEIFFSRSGKIFLQKERKLLLPNALGSGKRKGVRKSLQNP
jgi:hypothetical protein